MQCCSLCAHAEDEKTVTVTMEKATLGQGYIIKPVFYTFTGEMTVADVLVAILGEDKLKFDGAVDDSFYLEYVQDPASPPVVPEQILEMTGSLGERNSSDWLGEFDYTSTSGWVYTVNNILFSDAASDVFLKDGDVVRWQFTLAGYGRDLGYSIGSQTAPADKSNLLRLMAESAQTNETAETIALDPFANAEDIRRAEQLFSGGTPGYHYGSIAEETEVYPFEEVQGKRADKFSVITYVHDETAPESKLIVKTAPSAADQLVVVTTAETVREKRETDTVLMLYLNGQFCQFDYDTISEQTLRLFAEDRYNYSEIKLYVTLNQNGKTESFLAAGGKRLDIAPEDE